METEFTINNPMPPVWLMYPHISKYSIGWRMGYGEGYKFDLVNWLESLTAEEGKKYQELFPPPKLWNDYYDEINEDDEIYETEDMFMYNNEHIVNFWNAGGKPDYAYGELIKDISKGVNPEYIFFGDINRQRMEL